jgi:hypothetical protein
VHNLRNLLAKAPKTLQAAEKAQEAFVLNGRSEYPGVAASLEGAAAAQKKNFMTAQSKCGAIHFSTGPGILPPHLVFQQQLRVAWVAKGETGAVSRRS